MTKEILEGNKLIKDFYTNEHIRGQFGRILSADEYKYHFSWDWLMPVVEKIIKTHPLMEGAFANTSKVVDTLMYVQIDRTWKAVVQFIHFYNTQSK